MPAITPRSGARAIPDCSPSRTPPGEPTSLPLVSHCNDVIARYPDHEYPVKLRAASMAAAAMLAVPCPRTRPSWPWLRAPSTTTRAASRAATPTQREPRRDPRARDRAREPGERGRDRRSGVLPLDLGVLVVLDSLSSWSDLPPASRLLAQTRSESPSNPWLPRRAARAPARPHRRVGTRSIPLALPIVAPSVAPRLLLPTIVRPETATGAWMPARCCCCPSRS